MNSTLDTLHDTKTILLTTFKRDGSGVDTPVSIAFADGRAFFRTWDSAYKAKRLARDPAVRAAPSTLGGKPTGPAVAGRARLLDGDESRLAARALAGRHRVLHTIVVPLYHRLRGFKTLHYELTSDDAGG